ncbi:hypothetical protein BH10BAC5_BH10BAC5_15820 [soil metagenome]
MNTEPIIVQETYHAPIGKVWTALTEPVQMKEWFFPEMEEFKAETGFETQFSIHHNDKVFTHMWKVLAVVPGKKLTVRWRFEDVKGEAQVTYELLFLTENETKITLTNAGQENFPQDVPEFERESCREGWNYFLKGRLKNYLEGNQ